MKPLIIFLFYSVFPFFVQGQEISSGIISGTATDNETNKPVEGVNVAVFKNHDTLAFIIAETGNDGDFVFENLPHGYYRLLFTQATYQPLRVDSIYLRAERNDFNLNEIRLTKSASQLEAVIIYAEKPLFENKDGKIIFNTSESALSNSSSATDLLKQTPLVSVDADGKVQLKGKDAKILVDDKPVDLDSRQLQELLESMPGSMIEKIEVLTTPPPQYANERGGVINIVTKKGKTGLSGRLSLKYGTRNERGINGNANLRKGKWNISLNAGSSTNIYTGETESIRERFYADSSNKLVTGSKYRNKYIRPSLRFNADYDLNKYNLFNATVSMNANENQSLNYTEYISYNHAGNIYKRSTREQQGKLSSFSPNMQISYTHKGIKNSSILKLQQALYTNDNNNDRDNYQQYLAPDGSFSGDDSTLLQLTDLRVRNLVSRANFEIPLNKKLYLFSSMNYTGTQTSNRLNSFFQPTGTGPLVVNELLSNEFDFIQQIISTNASLRVTVKKVLLVTSGITWENAETYFNILNKTDHYRNAYDNFLPFVNFNRKWDNGYNITGSYKRTVQRPGINNLNPSIDHSDQYTVRTGNPYLQPYLADNFDAGAGYWQKKYNINFSLGYNALQHIYSLIRTLQPDGKTFVTYENLSGRKEYEANAWGGYTAGNKLKLSSSISYTYNAYSTHDKLVNRYRNGNSLRSSLNLQYVYSPLLTGTGNFSYNSFASPQGKSRTRLSMNLGVQRKFFNKNLSLSLNVIDPFIQLQNHNTIYGTNYIIDSYTHTITRNFKLAAAYNFKKKAKKKPQQKNPIPVKPTK